MNALASPETLSVQEHAIFCRARHMGPVSDRIARLFETIRNNSVPRIHLERSVLFTESFRQTEGQPIVLRWAMALEHIARHIPVTILPDELIVGRPNNAVGKYAILYPELDGSLFKYAAETIDKRAENAAIISSEDAMIMKDVLYPYWVERDYAKTFHRSLPDDVRNYIYGPDKDNHNRHTNILTCSAVFRHSQNWYHDYTKVIDRGFGALRAEAEQKLAGLIERGNPADMLEKRAYYQAVVITCNAIILWANRYADLAADMAKTETNLQRRQELETIAEVCRRVPEHPARTFQEGLQAQWFTQLFSRFEQNIGGQVGNGRMDQYLYHLYRADVDKGLPPEQVEELLQCVWLNMWQSVVVNISPAASAATEGYAHFEAVTVGGRTPDGRDATNELSYAILESSRPLQCSYPEIAVRIHTGTPERLLHAVAECIKDGKGTPKLLNDEVIIPFYLAHGAPYQEALDYGGSGCVETRLPNRETHVTGNGGLNYGALIEMTLRNGRMKIYGDHRFGPETGDPRTFKTYADFWQAFKTQMLTATEAHFRSQYTAIRLKPQFFAAPMASALHSLSMEHGMDLHRHGEYIPGGIDLSCLESKGLGTGIDSLAAVKQLVYDEHSVSMTDLLEALEADFEGHEIIHQLCLNAPKYGNDDPAVDAIGREVETALVEFLRDNPKPHGQSFMLRCIPITFHIGGGKVVNATPNGRKRGIYLSEGISASHGADVNGPTAALRSFAAVQPLSFKEKGADLLNMKFSPATVEGEAGTARLMALIRAWRDLKIWHIQFNIINKDTLVAAQSHPEMYRNLVVRVAGYCAYFVELSPLQQAEIIDRTESSM